MTKITVVFLVDDLVFLQHALGAIYILSESNDFNVEVVCDFPASIDLTSLLLLKYLAGEGLLNVESLPTKDRYDYVISQWGPPPGLLRRNAAIKRNDLLHKFSNLVGRRIVIPHGFEIKQNVLASSQALLRRKLLHFGNPFRDYKKYHKYFFDSDLHLNRYQNYLDGVDTPICGSITFNRAVITKIRALSHDVESYEEVIVMPKQAHVPNLEEIFESRTRSTKFVLHPRELSLQKDLARKHGIRKDSILPFLDLLKINPRTDVFDYGTSVSIIATALGAKVYFKNMTGHELLFKVDNPEGVSEVMSAGHSNYVEWFMEELVN